ncbi:alpha/beta fold hydrolase [Acuticoccus kandeliae]|uniref:alpha/beta fold hydrolase n=1 Tax=Acuticoccus kandeliae TaxID=2073160 RepID=UPI000D3E10D5|nr:alpha/beta hydrolase [Acuticoccus kandeliae]
MTNTLIARRDAFNARHPEARVTLNGREWGVIDVGTDGPVLILIPGTLGRADVFWQQMEALAPRARVLATTYPASGGVTEWADDLVALLDACGIDTATILGTSLGGYLVQHFGATHPERVAKLLPANTLVSTEASRSRPPYTLDVLSAPIADLRAGLHKGLGAWREAHPDQAELVDLLLGEVDGRIPEAELRTRLNALKTAPTLASVPIPATRIATIEGDDDPLIQPASREEVRAHLAPAVSYRFAWGGHFPYVVRPGLYTGLLETELGLPLTGEGWGEGAVRTR